jgi:MOSC domain-containing protein YiiM
MPSPTVLAVLIGQPAPFGPNGVESAIHKTPVDAAYVGPTGLEGDAHGDPAKHGGPEKAVHHYPTEHYRYWEAHGVTSPLLANPGAFGENVTSLGMTEENVCVGDVYRVGAGGPLLQVNQTRQPCWKLGLRFGIPKFPADVQRTGRTGWHYRVLENGTLRTGAAFELIERPHPAWPLARLTTTLYVNTLDVASLRELCELAPLPESFKELARHRIETSTVESWETRLNGRLVAP